MFVAMSDSSVVSSAYSDTSALVWSHRARAVPTCFPRTPWGHRGYEEIAVDTFVDQIVKDRDAAEEQISDLRAEVDRLHRYIRRQWAAVAAAESAGGRSASDGAVSPAAQARAVLSPAQEIAERRLAEADARLAEADARLGDVERLAADRLAVAERMVQAKLTDADHQASRLIGAGED